MRLRMRALAAIITLALPLAGCNTSSNGQAPTTEPPSTSTETSTAADGSSSQPAAVPSSAGAADSIPITIDIDRGIVTGTLSGNATARSLIGQLPLMLSFRDYGGQEKIAELPKALSLDGVPARRQRRTTDHWLLRARPSPRPVLRVRRVLPLYCADRIVR
jgi:Cyclophilin-like family